MAEDVAKRVVASCPVVAWEGIVWRTHTRLYAPDSPGDAFRTRGRWHRGGRDCPSELAFPVLYTSVDAAVSTWEFLRHAQDDDAARMWAGFLAKDLCKLRVTLPAALDLRDPSCAGLSVADLTGTDYELAQAISAAAYTAKLSGLLVPSASGVGEPGSNFNVVVYFDGDPGNVVPRPGSRVDVLLTQTPNLPT